MEVGNLSYCTVASMKYCKRKLEGEHKSWQHLFHPHACDEGNSSLGATFKFQAWTIDTDKRVGGETLSTKLWWMEVLNPSSALSCEGIASGTLHGSISTQINQQPKPSAKGVAQSSNTVNP